MSCNIYITCTHDVLVCQSRTYLALHFYMQGQGLYINQCTQRRGDKASDEAMPSQQMGGPDSHHDVRNHTVYSMSPTYICKCPKKRGLYSVLRSLHATASKYDARDITFIAKKAER